MSSHVPGNVSTYNEEMAPLLEKLKQSYVPVDAKAAFNQLLEHFHNDELDTCIEAAEELLKERIPDSTRTRVHILIAFCLADPDEMEEHYEKALEIWTLLNAQHGKNIRFEPFLQETHAQLDALLEFIEDERNVETDKSGSPDTPAEPTMSATVAGESAPVSSSSDPAPDTTGQPVFESSPNGLPPPPLEPSPGLTPGLPNGTPDDRDRRILPFRGMSSVNDGHIPDTRSEPIEDANGQVAFFPFTKLVHRPRWDVNVPNPVPVGHPLFEVAINYGRYPHDRMAYPTTDNTFMTEQLESVATYDPATGEVFDLNGVSVGNVAIDSNT